MERDDLLTFRVPSDVKLALKAAAEKDERSMSMMAVRILREWLAAHGHYAGTEGTIGRSRRRTR